MCEWIHSDSGRARWPSEDAEAPAGQANGSIRMTKRTTAAIFAILLTGYTEPSDPEVPNKPCSLQDVGATVDSQSTLMGLLSTI